MKIGIIGAGFVGQAILNAHCHHEVIVRDPKLATSVDLNKFEDCHAVFVCVPSPSLESGHCDASILEQVLSELNSVNNKIPVICKTTAPPSIYERLQIQYPNIVHCPEFLTAANNLKDYVNAEYFIIGGKKEWCERAAEVIRSTVPLVNERMLITDIKTAALYKYLMNSYLAAKVTFMNDFYQLSQAEGVNWKELTGLTVWDDRIGHTHMSVPGPDGKFGWGGICFPKDIAAIIEESLDLNAGLEILDRVEEINKKHRKKND